MKRAISLAALNAVYFGAAAACAAWCVSVYGLSTATSYVAGATACIYGFLSAASLLMYRPGKSASTVVELKPWIKLLLRATFLAVPVAYFTYVASFHVIQSTYCWPGGVARFDAFSILEYKLFHKYVCNSYIPADVNKRLTDYMLHTFTPWAERQWHAQDADHSYEVVCQFNLLKDGTIEKARIYKSTGSIECNDAARAAFDSIAPPMPPGSPDSCPIRFTFTFNAQPETNGWPVYDTNKITPAQDRFLFEQGNLTNNNCNYPRSQKLLKQCLEERRLRFKSGAPELTAVLKELADLHCRMGLLTDSQMYFDEAVKNAEIGKQSHPELLVETVHDYADQQFVCSKFRKALVLYKRCYSLNPSAFDRKAQIRLAETYYATKDYNSATNIFSKVVSADEHSPPKDEIYELDAERISLCNQYIKAGHPELATKLIDSCLSRSRCDQTKNPKSKYERLNLLSNFLPVYQKLPNKTLGKKYLQSAFAELSSTLDPLCPDVTMLRNCLAEAMWESGDKVAAIELFRKLVANYDGDVADRAYALFHQASFFYDKGMFAEAEQPLREALRIRQRLYERNDKRVINLKFALIDLLEVQKKSREASEIRDGMQVPVNEDKYQLASSYAGAGQLEKALAIYDAGIRESFKSDSEDRHGWRGCLLEEAVHLCEELNDDKRLEHYLKESYRSDMQRLGRGSRAQLVYFYIKRNRLAVAEELANQDVNDNIPPDKSETSAEALANAFLVLSQVKHAQQRHIAAKYYAHRAIQAMEPYGRSGVQTVAVGQLAQMLAKEGNTVGAERLLDDLYFSKLDDSDSAVYGDIVDGFNTNGCLLTSRNANEFKEANGQRFDPPFYQKLNTADIEEDYHYKILPEQMPMVSLNWTSYFVTTYDFAFLKACTLEARAQVQTLQGKFEDAARSRNIMFESIDRSFDQQTRFRDFGSIEKLLKRAPQSERQQQVLQRVHKLHENPDT